MNTQRNKHTHKTVTQNGQTMQKNISSAKNQVSTLFLYWIHRRGKCLEMANRLLKHCVSKGFLFEGSRICLEEVCFETSLMLFSWPSAQFMAALPSKWSDLKLIWHLLWTSRQKIFGSVRSIERRLQTTFQFYFISS